MHSSFLNYVGKTLFAITFLAIILFIVVMSSGCTTYKGLIPDKDVVMKNVKVNSPWTGMPIFSADEIDTRKSTVVP
jgi:hypothetical protein